MVKHYVQYGCGLSAPETWINFDASPTLRIQRNPILRLLFKKKMNVIFPKNVRIGDIIQGLPIEQNSCQGVYASHVLEHLSLDDFRIALHNTFLILKPNGYFRCIVPDLEYAARKYIQALDHRNVNASLDFCGPDTLMGVVKRPKGMSGMMRSYLSNAHHLWMWDFMSLTRELENAGFRRIRKCSFNDCDDVAFRDVEDEDRFLNAVAIECRK